MSGLTVRWQRRELPLTPAALAVRNEHLGSLQTRLQRRQPEALRSFEIVRFEDGVVVSGPAAQLPWVERGLYLGRDPQASAMTRSS